MQRTSQSEAGISLVEVTLAAAILLVASLSLAFAFTSSGLASRFSDRSVVVRASLGGVAESVADVPYEQLLSWNGVTVDRGDHSVIVAANLVRVGLVLVEYTVSDDRTGQILARLATYRAQGA